MFKSFCPPHSQVGGILGQLWHTWEAELELESEALDGVGVGLLRILGV